MSTQIKNKRTAKLADDMIGAAQALEQAARRLKDTAKGIRQTGLTMWDFDPVQNITDWAGHDIKRGAMHALRAMGVQVDFLKEVVWEENPFVTEHQPTKPTEHQP